MDRDELGKAEEANKIARKANKISILALVVSGFFLCVTIVMACFSWQSNQFTIDSNKIAKDQVSIYRQELALQYSPIIDIEIITTNDPAAPGLRIKNPGKNFTKIVDCKFILIDSEKKQKEVITNKDLGNKLAELKIAPGAYYDYFFENLDGKHVFHDKASNSKYIYWVLSIDVENPFSLEKEQYRFSFIKEKIAGTQFEIWYSKPEILENEKIKELLKM